MVHNLTLGIICVLASCHALHAQTWDEWFKQKKTQKQYLIKQIALLNTYAGYLKKGYDLAEHGLNIINNAKDGEFSLHRDFLGARKSVNPHLAKSAKVADIVAFQFLIVKRMKAVTKFSSNTKGLTPENVRYIASVYLNMIRLSDASLSELLDLAFSDRLEMTDDQRLKRIDGLHAETMDQVAFTKQFQTDVIILAHARIADGNAVTATSSQQGL